MKAIRLIEGPNQFAEVHGVAIGPDGAMELAANLGWRQDDIQACEHCGAVCWVPTQDICGVAVCWKCGKAFEVCYHGDLGGRDCVCGLKIGELQRKAMEYIRGMVERGEV